MKTIIKLITTCFYIGYSRYLPGTLGTFAGFLAYVFFIRGNLALHLIVVTVLAFFGFVLCPKAEKIFNHKDARQIVIDDFCGMLIGLLFLPYDFRVALIGFGIFRIMDGLKPYPIYKIEKAHGGIGVMGDDIVAGIYTNIVLRVFLHSGAINS